LNRLQHGETLFIAEGCSDCWSLLSAGHKAIAIPSATLLSKKDVALLQALSSERSVSFEMWPDNDTPGESLFLQLQQVLPALVRHQLPQGCKDFSDYYIKY
jgi:DNA primase